MEIRHLTFHADPGHGWLQVAFPDLLTLGINKQISTCSYQKNNFVYLEEDVDAGIFVNAAKEAGWQLQIVEKYTNIMPPQHPSIRNYRQYTGMNV